MATNPPGFRRRIVCMLYEGLVVFSILLIGFLLPQIVLSGFGWTVSPKLLWIHIVVLLGSYFIWCWLNGGQTLPMKTWRFRLINMDGSPIRPLQAVFRYLVAWPSIMLLGIGIVWAIFDEDRLFLHDRIAGTRIINAT